MHAGRDSIALALEAERFRSQARLFAIAAQEARNRGDVDAARTHEITAADYRIQAADAERTLRGLPPLPPVGL